MAPEKLADATFREATPRMAQLPLFPTVSIFHHKAPLDPNHLTFSTLIAHF